MAGRPPLSIDTHGNIKVTQLGTRLYQARCRYRGADGETKPVKRTGASASAARNNLLQALGEKRGATSGEISGDTRLRVVAERWFDERRVDVEDGHLSRNSLELYETAWRRHIEPGLGSRRVRECTVQALEQWKKELLQRVGPSGARSARKVLHAILGLATSLGALGHNPVRDMSPIRGKKKAKPRSLSMGERAAWLAAMEDEAGALAQLEAAREGDDAAAVELWSRRLRVVRKAKRWGVPDLVRFLLATGVRIGEALAVSWDEVDLDAGTVTICWHLVPHRGVGIERVQGAKSEAGDRVLALPRWAVDMLMARRVESSFWPVFPDKAGGWRWPGNALKVLREVRAETDLAWVTSHTARKTALTHLDEKGLSARVLADVAGHADPSMTQSVYMGRGSVSIAAAAALEDVLGEGSTR